MKRDIFRFHIAVHHFCAAKRSNGTQDLIYHDSKQVFVESTIRYCTIEQIIAVGERRHE
jgi:hypothetical protein